MAFDAFLKLDGITENEIRLESFSWGVSNSASGTTGAGAAKPSFQDFSFVTLVGRQSPKFFEAVALGQHIPTATLTVTDKFEPLVVVFSDVFISSYKLDEAGLLSNKAAEGGLPAVQLAAPMESVSFNFTKIEFSAGGTTATGGIIG
jgi:type VI protein secretion system component Hcp